MRLESIAPNSRTQTPRIVTRTAQPTPATLLPVAHVGLVRSLFETSKPGITRLVTFTAGIAFVLGIAESGVWEGRSFFMLAMCLLGTAFSASGANALNQVVERDRDARMPRTRGRPIPSGRVAARTVALSAGGIGVAGVAILWLACGWLPAIVSALTIASYVLVYTPMKAMSPYSTWVGAIPGALPTLIGWTAASGASGLTGDGYGAWALFLILFVWQIPHFLAIAWMYQDDYAAGGFKVLPVVDQTGKRTASSILLWTVFLIPVSVAPMWMLDSIGPVYGGLAALSGLVFLGLAIRLVRARSFQNARRVFFASIIHLPLLLVALLIDAIV